MPPKHDLSFSGIEEFVNEPIVSEPTVKKPVVETSKAKASEAKSKAVRKNNGALIIEDWVSDSEEEDMPQANIEKKIVKSSFAKIEFVKSKEQVKSPRKTTVKQGDQNRQNTHTPRGNQRNWNNRMSQRLRSNFEMINKAFYVCGSFDHLQYNCDNHQRQFNNKKMVKPVWNYNQRVNNQNSSRMTHSSPKRNMVIKAVLTRSGLLSLTTARPVNTAQPKITENSARPMKNTFNKAHSTVGRPIDNKTTTKNSNFNQRVNTISGKNVKTARPKAIVNDARPKAILNAVKGNQVNVVKASACWVWKLKTKGNPQQDLHKQGVIDSGCSRHMTGNMSYLTDFKEIDGGYVAFGGKRRENHKKSVSQMCDKKNSVLFNDTECIVLSPNFKLTDESHVLLKVPRKDNMYSVDLKNVVPKGGLTCLFAKSTSDESKLWHSRFSWVFFLATKDETSGILKSFITGVENLIDQRVKVIRCDNGTEFKNKEMNQFCERKGIKREFSVARTPQQNGVAERKNKTLIEAARTMLADSKLPTTFWAEAVNTACYVQNRVLVIKPHNKTPYELFLGRKPALGFMRPFGCPVIILNTIDHLGKFDGKADEGFFVGYSINRSGLNWLFDIDALTKSMNYKAVVAGNQSNGNASTKACDDTSKASMEKVHGKDYILLPLWLADLLFSQCSKSSPDARFKPSSDGEKKVDGDLKVNVVGAKTSIELPDDPNMPKLEDIVYSDDDEDVGAEADMNNLDVFIPIPTTRIHKDHPLEQIIGYLNPTPQTRRMTKNLEKHEEPKKVIHALKDPSWIKAMQDELLQFKLQKVWTLVDLPNGKRAIGTKWVFRNKKDERGIVIKNKARLMDVKSAFLYGKIEEEVYVCQPPGFEDPDFPDRVYKVEKALYGLHQAPRACDILLVQVYVDDIIFGSTKKSLCTEFEKMVHKKFQMSSIDVKTASTPMETQKPLLKDEDCEEVDVHLYRSMIGSLMYLTSSRPDIMFAVCACARYQLNPKVSHLYDVKRIFRYLKGQPKLGLWYPKDSPFDLVAYINSDYAGASLDRKSITGGCQFLGCRLISWQCKKQTVVANSTTEAEYVAASSCFGQVLWIQNQLLDYGYNFMHTKIYIDNESTICIVKNPVFHSKTKHIEIRHHFIRDSNEKKLIQMIKIHTNKNVADLLTKAFDVSIFQYLIASIGMLNL
ncbi:putative ribonuclease H-like domain-containing protein [Tanacetum coccineum]